MPCDASFVKAIQDNANVPETIEQDGVEVVALPAGWKVERRHRATSPEVLRVYTLRALCDATKTGILDLEGANAVIVDYRTVGLYSGEKSDHLGKYRTLLASAENPAEPHPFNTPLSYEEFVVWVRARFIQDAHLQGLLELVAAITSSDVEEQVDDGVTQTVATRRGIRFTDTSKVNPYWILTPHRTFREVAQPGSLFLLRLTRSGGEKPRFALYEADGGSWKLDAVDLIRDHLEANLSQAVKLIG